MTNDELEDEKQNESYVLHDLRERINQKLKNDKKQHILSLVIYYLKKSKKNYIYFEESDNDDTLNLGMQINQLIFDSKKNLNNLNSTDIYQISKSNNSFNVTHIKNETQKSKDFIQQHKDNSFDELYISYVCNKISKLSNKKFSKILPKEIESYDNIQLILDDLEISSNNLNSVLNNHNVDINCYDAMSGIISNLNEIIVHYRKYYQQMLISKNLSNRYEAFNLHAIEVLDDLKRIVSEFNRKLSNHYYISLLREIHMAIHLQNQNNTLKDLIDLEYIFKQHPQNGDASFETFIDYNELSEEDINILYQFSKDVSDHLSTKDDKLIEKGLFYPASFHNSFLKKVSEIVEIDIYKYDKSKEELKKDAELFYSMFNDFDIHSSNKNDYLQSFSVNFRQDIAYFNPFILVEDTFLEMFFDFAVFLDPNHNINLITLTNEKYHNSTFFQKLNNMVDDDGLNPNQHLQIYNFFNIINEIQFDIIKRQQENLFNAFSIFDSNYKSGVLRTVSIKHYIEYQIYNLQTNENINNPDIAENMLILTTMLKHVENIKKNTDLTIDDFGFDSWECSNCKQNAKNILEIILTSMNKDKKNSLKSLHEEYMAHIEKLFNEINLKLNIRQRAFIDQLLIYLISGTLDTNMNFNYKTYYNNQFETLFYESISNSRALKKKFNSKISSIGEMLRKFGKL